MISVLQNVIVITVYFIRSLIITGRVTLKPYGRFFRLLNIRPNRFIQYQMRRALPLERVDFMKRQVEYMKRLAALICIVCFLSAFLSACRRAETPAPADPVPGQETPPAETAPPDAPEQMLEAALKAVNVYYLGRQIVLPADDPLAEELSAAFFAAMPEGATDGSVAGAAAAVDMAKADGICVELELEDAPPIAYKDSAGNDKSVEAYTSLLIDVLSDSDRLYYANAGVYGDTVLEQTQNVDELRAILHGNRATLESVLFGDGEIEVGSERIAYIESGSAPLLEELSPDQIESMLFRSVRFYAAAHAGRYDIVRLLSGEELNDELTRVVENNENANLHGAQELTQLRNYTDAALPERVIEPQRDESREGAYFVILSLDAFSDARISFAIAEDGTPLITDFALIVV